MITLDFSNIQLKLKKEAGRTLVFDPVRKIWALLTPEEHVRQYLIAYLKDVLNYPVGMIAVEKKIMVGSMAKRFDLIVYDRRHQPWLLAEVKAPDIRLTQAALHQLLNYQRTMQCHYWLLTNGHQTFCADACDPASIQWMEALPPYVS